ncbi:hypothetical protein [Methylobacterium iners]|uniref:Transposase IS30-like HTH domain-containing protein n=1 Tax=Methylobacterium iners TaxID=418707 RepID=A0ABQ4RTG4_9HYPH|nr:hypothetical protein [Methylobacterium iners]GJD92877.1 hypothetical protein OCOJLMKI_0060 [Methylobacterium iners]
MPTRKLTDAELDRLVEMRERGKTHAVIARALGCSVSAVSYQCLRLGVETPKPPSVSIEIRGPLVTTRNGYMVRRFTPEDDAQILAMEAEQRSVSEIARHLGRQPHSVRQRLMTLARREARLEACA